MADPTGRGPVPIREQEPAWAKYLTDYDEGLGLVYERLVLNDFLDALVERFQVRNALEAPIFGMAGVSGINSVRLAQRGCRVTLVDDNPVRLHQVERIWGELNLSAAFCSHTDLAHLPFPDRAFDLVWEWAALWYHPNAADILRELARVSRRLVFVAMPNRAQVGYLLRKYVLEREFVRHVDESWADLGRIKSALRECGVRIVQEGVLDVPPWPDTVMPAAQVMQKFGIRTQLFSGSNWNWSTMDYYLGRRPELRAKINRYTYLERAPLPWQIKAVWAHHRYALGRVDL